MLRAGLASVNNVALQVMRSILQIVNDLPLVALEWSDLATRIGPASLLDANFIRADVLRPVLRWTCWCDGFQRRTVRLRSVLPSLTGDCSRSGTRVELSGRAV
jgi:hypothetical protein